MNLEEYTLGAFVLIGLVNGIQLALERNWKSFVKFMCAVIAGGLFGYLGWFDLPNLETGIALGIASSGTYKMASKIGTLK